MKIYLILNKDTKIVKGNEDTLATAKRKIEEDKNSNEDNPYKRNYKNCEVLEIEKSEWDAFIDTNPEIIKIEDGELKSEKRIFSLEELKSNAIGTRKAYRRQIQDEWFDDIENMPQEIKEKSKKAKREIKEIEAITNIDDLEQYNEFN